MTFNTGNPLGSTDPRDLSDNSENLDKAVNDLTSPTWTDRFGNTRTTLAGQIGYIGTGVDGAIESYTSGLLLTTYSTIIEYNGEFYRPSASAALPYTTTATLPDADSNLVAVGDAVLRQDLAQDPSTAGNGVLLVNGAVHRVSSRTEMKGYDVPAGYQFSLEEGGRSGIFVVKTGTPPSDPQEGIYVVLDNGNYAERVFSDRVNIEWYGAIGDGVADSTAAIQAAVDSGFRGIFIPEGRYVVSDTIREATNAYALDIVGASKYLSILEADPAMSVPVLWVGNSNGNGNYRATFENFNIIGSTLSGCHGLVLHEAGNSSVRNLRITSCDYGIFCPGMIGARIRDCEMGANNTHIRFTTPVAGTPSGPDDTTTTASPLSLHPNVNTVDSIWMTNGTQGVYLGGAGLTRVTGCTFQSVGDSASTDLVQLVNANESPDYGGGPIIENNWFEGGIYRSAVYVDSTRYAVIRGNFISGTNASSEAGIIAENSDQIVIEQNSIRGGFSATVTDGRAANAPIYVNTNTCFHYKVRDNYVTDASGDIYFEGEASPATPRNFWPVAAGRFTAGATPSIDKSYQFTSITRSATGTYRCRTDGKFNVEDPDLQMYSLTVIGNVPAHPVVGFGLAGYVQVEFYDGAGALVDVDAFSLIVYGDPLGLG